LPVPDQFPLTVPTGGGGAVTVWVTVTVGPGTALVLITVCVTVVVLWPAAEPIPMPTPSRAMQPRTAPVILSHRLRDLGGGNAEPGGAFGTVGMLIGHPLQRARTPAPGPRARGLNTGAGALRLHSDLAPAAQIGPKGTGQVVLCLLPKLGQLQHVNGREGLRLKIFNGGGYEFG
jgi:hypothetical protein